MAPLNIYFCGSICGGREDASRYLTIVNHLKKYGTVLNEVVADPTLTDQDRIPAAGECEIHDRDVKWFHQSDVLIAEVTQPSLGVGYELGMAVQNKKKTLALFRPNNAKGRKLSAMIRGAPSNNGTFQVKDYTDADILSIIDTFLEDLVKEKESS